MPEGREIPIAHAVGVALIEQGFVKGPCIFDRARCPISEGETYHPGKCALEGCRRARAGLGVLNPIIGPKPEQTA